MWLLGLFQEWIQNEDAKEKVSWKILTEAQINKDITEASEMLQYFQYRQTKQ